MSLRVNGPENFSLIINNRQHKRTPVKKIKANYTSGHDNTPNLLLSDWLSMLVYPVYILLFNLILKTSTFLD